jgi:hypothetical protein
MLKAEVTPQVWDRTFGLANRELGNPKGSYAKNPVHIGEHLEILAGEGINPVSLDQVCRNIIAFADKGAVSRVRTSGTRLAENSELPKNPRNRGTGFE